MKPAHDGFILSTAERFSPRFWRSVIANTAAGCWTWGGYVAPNGYGQFTAHTDAKSKKRITLWAHRYAFLIVRGKIGDGLYLDHLCRNRSCVNPSHLEPVSARENLLRGKTLAAINASKTHCKNGHELAGENLYLRGRIRFCRKCRAAASKRYELKRPPRSHKAA